MKALILAAGYATRLYPLTKEYPKPLLEVGEKPIINYIVEKLEALDDIDEIIVVTNSKFISKFKSWLKHLHSSKRISLVDDLTKSISDRRGAIGDMAFAINKKRLKDGLIVMGGDNLFNTGLKEFYSFAKRKNAPVIGVYGIKNKAEAKKYGVIKLDREKRIVDFQEKPENPVSKLVAMCLYYFPKEKLGFIGEYLKRRDNKNDATGFYINWLSRKTAVYGFVFDGFWYDIGDHKFYRQAKQRLMKNAGKRLK